MILSPELRLALTTMAALTLAACATERPEPEPRTSPDPVTIDAEDDHWKKIAEDLTRGRSLAEQEMIHRSQHHYEIALAYHARSDFDRAREQARKAVAAWPGNRAARVLLHELLELIDSPGALPVGAGHQVRIARVRIEQTQIEIAKHLRDGERYFNARMFGHALREFEAAEFKIHAIPYDVHAMNRLLPRAGEMRVRARNALELERRAIERPR